jgi:hypothetical protein
LVDANFINGELMLSSLYNFPKLIVSLIQTIWAINTLYRARGDQIQEYGYAAFGLTVAPYAWMSVVNIVANLFNPNYPALYMIRTPIMNEAEAEGGFFRCAIKADIGEERRPEETLSFDQALQMMLFLSLSFFLALVPLIIVGSLSGFTNGKSTSIQRGFTLSWLIVGIVYGTMIDYVEKIKLLELTDISLGTTYISILVDIAFLCWFVVPPIGGMTVVGLMLRDFGVCTNFR